MDRGTEEFFNYRESTRYPKPVHCAKCNVEKIGAHLYLIRFDHSVWDSIYLVGCSHEDYDGKDWCDNCMTIADGEILCSNCAYIEWGAPFAIKGKPLLNYMWSDGTTSKHPVEGSYTP